MTTFSAMEALITKFAWEVFNEEFGDFSYDLTDEQYEIADDIQDDIVSEMIGHAEDAVCIEFREVINRRRHELNPYLADNRRN